MSVQRKPKPSSEELEATIAAPKPDEELMTTRDLMAFLNLSRTKIWEYVQYEGLPAFKLGGDYRYRKSEVVAWLENYRVKSDPGKKKKKSSS